MRDNKTKGCSNCSNKGGNKGGNNVSGCANVSDCAEKAGPKSSGKNTSNKMSK